MTNEEIIREFAALPDEARQEAENFIAFLRERYGKKNKKITSGDFRKENFVGMWKDREDMQDSSTFVCELRKNEWAK